jgi:protoporphyrinogen oxidase
MPKSKRPDVILGGGVTGLAAGIASGCPVYEREAHGGGICSSYYMRRNSATRLQGARSVDDAYRFEHGGGHWLFGGHPDVLSIVEHLAPCERIARRSSVYFAQERRYVGFPLQHHLHALGPAICASALAEIRSGRATSAATMAESLDRQFGSTLGALFFRPFHDSYTAGLWREIAPQDDYKTPLDLEQIERGALEPAAPAGYNTSFLYPREGLDALIASLAARADLRCGHEVRGVDPTRREIVFTSGQTRPYARLLSTLPLNRMMELTGLDTGSLPAPYTSVLVLNIGARRGPRCPSDHWLYIPRSATGFHRVGFYSNVAEHFLPAADRGGGTAVCLYVERSYRGGEKPSGDDIARYAAAVVAELQDWGFIGEIDVVDPSWVDVAYTWKRPGSAWVGDATAALAGHDIRMAGRYARWTFQGILDSLRDGFLAGQALRQGA